MSLRASCWIKKKHIICPDVWHAPITKGSGSKRMIFDDKLETIALFVPHTMEYMLIIFILFFRGLLKNDVEFIWKKTRFFDPHCPVLWCRSFYSQSIIVFIYSLWEKAIGIYHHVTILNFILGGFPFSVVWGGRDWSCSRANKENKKQFDEWHVGGPVLHLTLIKFWPMSVVM